MGSVGTVKNVLNILNFICGIMGLSLSIYSTLIYEISKIVGFPDILIVAGINGFLETIVAIFLCFSLNKKPLYLWIYIILTFYLLIAQVVLYTVKEKLTNPNYILNETVYSDKLLQIASKYLCCGYESANFYYYNINTKPPKECYSDLSKEILHTTGCQHPIENIIIPTVLRFYDYNRLLGIFQACSIITAGLATGIFKKKDSRTN